MPILLRLSLSLSFMFLWFESQLNSHTLPHQSFLVPLSLNFFGNEFTNSTHISSAMYNLDGEKERKVETIESVNEE